YTLIRLFPTTDDQMGALFEFRDPQEKVEVLKSSRGYNDSLDVLVPSARMGFMEDFVRHTDVKAEIEENYGRLVYSPWYRESLIHHLVMPEECYAALTSSDIIHSMPEWVAPAMALYLIHRLANDPEAKDTVLNGVDWYILPLVNPDGSKNGNCFGVDGNRNYGFKWAVSGVSFDPCNAETYAGPQAFSEPETQMVRNVMIENAKKIKLYVSLHSYGQYLVYPWGYGSELPKTWKKLDTLAREVSKSVQRAGGKPFRVLSAGNWYPAAGGSDDFAFGGVGVPYSYTMELTDGYEFVFPESLLKKVLPEFYEGFKTFANQIRREFRPAKRQSRVDGVSDASEEE
ncbi:hypothetical protein OBRU01_22100, partial [Operophtera brumata]